jgi:phosphopantothenoylcysteine decarboxylase/phosphopantothenate--cysteine ligase
MRPLPLSGLRALVTSGPTREPIDSVRFISNRSSGEQGLAIAVALAAAGATTVLVSGPTALAAPPELEIIDVETATEMNAACQAQLPVDIVVCAAAVADWRVRELSAAEQKMTSPANPPVLEVIQNEDILRELSRPGPRRPRLVVGFMAESRKVAEHAAEKRVRKRCDWVVAKVVDDAQRRQPPLGEDCRMVLVSRAGVEWWPRSSKAEIADRLVGRIAEFFAPSRAVLTGE